MSTATLSSCPPVRDLQELESAREDDPATAPLRQHLEQCHRCREIWRAFHPDRAAPPAGDDSVTWQRGLRPPAPGGEGTGTSPAPGRPPSGKLVSRVVPLEPTSPAGLPAATEVSDPDSTHQLLALVAPPQGPGEIGRLGSYRLLEILGRGATGVVFLAEDIQLTRRVALKVMRPGPDADERARQRFLREARAAAGLEHDHLVTIYQVGEDRGLPYLAMKFLRGETLDDRLKRERQLTVRDVLRIGREIAEGLDAAHERGLIHRDIKPANIYLEAGTDRVKIVDFGLARAVSDDLHLTRTGTIVGTPAYMSPEQARGAPVDQCSDLFSLGSVLYRMCTGRTPFLAEDTMSMLLALANDQPPPIAAFNNLVPGPLIRLIDQLLAKLPEARPQSARVVAAKLRAIENALAASFGVGGPGRVNKGKAASPRRPLATWIQIIAALGLGLSAYWYGPTALRVLNNLWHTVQERFNSGSISGH